MKNTGGELLRHICKSKNCVARSSVTLQVYTYFYTIEFENRFPLGGFTDTQALILGLCTAVSLAGSEHQLYFAFAMQLEEIPPVNLGCQGINFTLLCIKLLFPRVQLKYAFLQRVYHSL